jgi:GT2 family glycosyltransferase
MQSIVGQGLIRIILVDNASTDDSANRMREWLLSVDHAFLELTESEIPLVSIAAADETFHYVLIHSSRNGGYAAGNNLGIRFALQLVGTDYIFVLNNDTTLEPNSISRLVACADREPAIGAVGSTLIEDGGQLRIAGGAKYSPLSTRTILSLATDCASAPPIDYVAGAALFIRATALRTIGLLCEDYFLYFEEVDFARRLISAGFQIAWCPGSIVHHKRGRAAGSRSKETNKKSMDSEYHSNLSCLIFTRKFHPRLFWLAAPIRFTLKLVHDSIHQPGLIVPLVKAYRDCFIRMRRTAG